MCGDRSSRLTRCSGRRSIWHSSGGTPDATSGGACLRPRLPGSRSGGQYALEPGEVIQDSAGAAHDAGQRVGVTPDREPGLLAEQPVEAADECATAGERNAVVQDVAGEL